MVRKLLFILLFSIFHITQVFAQMTVKDSDDNILMQVIDEGLMGSIVLKDTSDVLPSEDNKLYSRNDSLIWNGQALGVAGSGGNTLDQAYDEGGGGAGRTITADAGAFKVAGVDGALFTGSYGSGTIPIEGSGIRMMWYPRRVAFRVGYVNSSQWNDVNIGHYSTAMGYNTIASGSYSTATGFGSTAEGNYSSALCGGTTASGNGSVAMGSSTISSGFTSTSMGYHTTAESYASVAMGRYNVGGGTAGGWIPTDPLFEIGIGTGSSAPTNALTVLKNGNVGIGISDPGAELDVDGKIKTSEIQVGSSTTPGFVLTADGSGIGTWQAPSGGGGGNTLDQAYDEGGAGAGRTIIADAGAFHVAGVDGALFTGTSGSGTIPAEGAGSRLMWYPHKAAFRAGAVYGSESTFWDADSIGYYSVAMGLSTRARGYYSTAIGQTTKASGGSSTAMGRETTASGEESTAMGYNTIASSTSSTAMGRNTTASGIISTALGRETTAEGYASTAMGRNTLAEGDASIAMGYYSQALGDNAVALGGYNNLVHGDNATAMGYATWAASYASVAIGRFNVAGGSSSTWAPTDPLFEIGIGTDYGSSDRANAMTVLKNGNVGIGTATPSSLLDVKGNVTIRDASDGSVVIELGTGLDYAEGFDVSDNENIGSGTVLCIDSENPGNLKMSERYYDPRVAGIVAGAKELGSGISLGSGKHDLNVALAGRVYCNVDASQDAVKAGDLLTTSDLPGYAKKVIDYQKSQGAVLGKAMENLEKGKTGQILVLVTLQ